MTRITSRPAALLVLVASLATFFVAAPIAGTSAAAPAQTCTDPYGCPGTTTTTTAPPTGGVPQCIVSQNSGRIGVDVDVTVTNVPLGIRVNLLLNGLQVDTTVAGGTGSAAADLSSPQGNVKSAKSASQTAGLADVHFDFRVPTGPSGAYTLVAVGDGFSCDCFPFTILRSVSDSTDQNPGNGGGSLARTGFTVLGLLVLAAVLLVFGRAMVEASRRRNRGTPAA